MTTELPPTLRDRFKVLGELGRGSFGRVLEVRDHQGVVRALKLLEGDLDLQRLGRELTASQAIQHPHVLTVHEVGLVDGVGFLVMERAAGTLEDWMGDPARVAAAWEALRQVASGLAALHAEKIVHRDLKPENVMMVEGAAKVGDLGLAKGGDLRTLTDAGWVMGTPAYMAPEQARGEALTPAADVFALGVMLFQVATGRLPYDASTPGRILPDLARGGPVASGELPPGLPEVVRACLDPDPAQRPDAEQLSQDLGPAPRGSAPPAASPRTRKLVDTAVVSRDAPAVTPARGGAPPGERSPIGRVLPGVCLLGLLIAGALSTLGAPEPTPPPSAPAPSTPEAVLPSWPPALGEGFAVEARRDLERARNNFLTPAGELRTLDDFQGSPPRTWRPLLDRDPAGFRQVVSHIPTLRRWYLWLAEGGRPETLEDEVQDLLRDVDERFRPTGLTEPFAPWLGLTTLRGAPVSPAESLPMANHRLESAPPLSGWGGAFVRAVENAFAAERTATDAVVRYLEGGTSLFPGAQLEKLPMMRRLRAEAPEQARELTRHLDQPMALGSLRVELLDWYRPFATQLTRMVYLAFRAIREQPAESPTIVPLLDIALEKLGGGRYGGWWILDRDVLTGGPALGALELTLLAILADHRTRTRREFGELRLALDLETGRPWLAPFQATDARVLERQPWYPWLVRNLLRSQAEVAPWAELVELRRRHEDALEAMRPAHRSEVALKLAEALSKARPRADAATRERYAKELEALQANLGAPLQPRVPKVLKELRVPSP